MPPKKKRATRKLAPERGSRGRTREGALFTAAPSKSGLPTGYARTLQDIKAHLRSARVRAVLRRAVTGSAPRGAPPVAVLPLAVDEATRRATVNGRAIELTRVEFDLLACMLSAPGRVFTRAQLIDRVWGDGFAITDRTVDSHVKGLRRKVTDAGGDAALVETVRGVGYRLRSEGA